MEVCAGPSTIAWRFGWGPSTLDCCYYACLSITLDLSAGKHEGARSGRGWTTSPLTWERRSLQRWNCQGLGAKRLIISTSIKGPLESERAAVDTLSLELEILFPLGEMHTGARLATGALVQAYYVDDEIFKDFTILCWEHSDCCWQFFANWRTSAHLLRNSGSKNRNWPGANSIN